MTEDDKNKRLAEFQRQNQNSEPEEDWTEEELLEHARRIIRKLGLTEELQ